MEYINKVHPGVKQAKTAKKPRVLSIFLRSDLTKMNFNTALVKAMSLKANERIGFLTEAGRLWMYVTDDPNAPRIFCYGSKETFAICGIHLLTYLNEHCGLHKKTSHVVKTPGTHNGNQLWEITTRRNLKKI